MSSRPPLPWRALVLMVLLLSSAVALQAFRERHEGGPASTAESLLYVRSPETMKRLALSYDSLLADLYWIRTVQYYGGNRLAGDPAQRYELLFPLLDLTTSLEPRFDVAYLFGSIFLAEAPPGGPGRPDLAITLLEKGLRAQPEKWQLAQALGFVHYWWRHDYVEAAKWFTRGSEFPGAPFWLKTVAATTLAEGGNRASSRLLWEQVGASVEHEGMRREAERRLQQLTAMDHLEQLHVAADAYSRRLGTPPPDWDALRRAGYLTGNPIDPTGVPYEIRDGRAVLGRGSRLAPLPAEPQRLPR